MFLIILHKLLTKKVIEITIILNLQQEKLKIAIIGDTHYIFDKKSLKIEIFTFKNYIKY